MYETNEEIAEMVGRLYGECEELARGDILTREAIGAVVGVEPNTAHWGYVVHKLRRRMERERHISMMPVTEVGFVLCTVQQQIELAQYRQRRASRQIRRGERSLKALDSADGLTMHQKRLRSASLEGLRKSRLKIAEEIRLAESIAVPTPTLPRRRPRPVVVDANS